MKTTRYLLIGLMMIATVLASCKKDKVLDEDNNNEKPPIENLPPDDEPVAGTIFGEISEVDFDAQKSESSIVINRIPHTITKFLELRNQVAHTPQGAAIMMLVAMRIYQQYPIEGMKCLTAACTTPLIVPSTGAGNYDGYVMGNISELKRKLTDYAYLPYIYYEGAGPSNGYKPNGPPYTVDFMVNMYSYISSTDGSLRIKVYVKTEGADSPRPVTVRKIGDHYKITEYSSLYLAPKPVLP